MPVIDHWWQTETGWSIAANCMGIELLPVKPARRPGRCRAGTCRCWTPRGTRCRPARSAPSPASCPCRRAPPRPCGTPRSASATPTSTNFPGYYEDRRCRLHRRGRLRLRHGPHRRHHQRRRPPALHRRHGGGAGRPSRRRRVRGDRRGRPPEGPAAGRLPGAEGRRRATTRWSTRWSDGARPIGPVAAFKQATVVKRLPKTRSGKILRATMRKIASSTPSSPPRAWTGTATVRPTRTSSPPWPT